MVAITEMTNWAVDLIDVRKTYGRRIRALGGVNIQVGRGEVFGLLGPNGAGKSTLVKIMTTVVRPTHALGTILGRPIGHRGKLACIGYLPENHSFPGYLTGMKVLDYYAALSKVPRAERRQRAHELLERVGMQEWAHTRTEKYSKGMLQRLGIAQALINHPELLILDEPTDGLDPVGRRDVRTLLLELRDQGATVFLNSHLLSELEMVCDRVAILVKGLVARQGTLAELTEHTLEYRVTAAADVGSIRPRLDTLGVSVNGHLITIPGGDVKRVNQVVDAIRHAGIMIEAVERQRFSLEDVLVETLGTSASPPVARPVAGDNRSLGRPT